VCVLGFRLVLPECLLAKLNLLTRRDGKSRETTIDVDTEHSPLDIDNRYSVLRSLA
jgi:hypothetical protein